MECEDGRALGKARATKSTSLGSAKAKRKEAIGRGRGIAYYGCLSADLATRLGVRLTQQTRPAETSGAHEPRRPVLAEWRQT